MRVTTATARQSDFALRSEENSIQTPNGISSLLTALHSIFICDILVLPFLTIINYYVTGKENSPVASEPCNVPSPQSVAKKCSPNTVQGNSALHDEFPGFSNPNDVKQTGRQCYDVSVPIVH